MPMDGRIPGASLFGGNVPPGASVRPSGPGGPGMPPGGAPGMPPGGPGGPEGMGDPVLQLIMILADAPPEVLQQLGLPPNLLEEVVAEADRRKGGAPGGMPPGPGGPPAGGPPTGPSAPTGSFQQFMRGVNGAR